MGGYDTSRFEVEFSKRALPSLLESRAAELGDKIFFMHQDEQVTYGQLDQSVNRVANSLRSLGIQKGDKVCFLMKNSLEFIYCWFALGKLGAIMVPINPNLKGNLLQYIINNSGATVAIADIDLLDRLEFIQDNIQTVKHLIVVTVNSQHDRHCVLQAHQTLSLQRSFGREHGAAWGRGAPFRHYVHPVHIRNDRTVQGRRIEPPLLLQYRLVGRLLYASFRRRCTLLVLAVFFMRTHPCLQYILPYSARLHLPWECGSACERFWTKSAGMVLLTPTSWARFSSS